MVSGLLVDRNVPIIVNPCKFRCSCWFISSDVNELDASIFYCTVYLKERWNCDAAAASELEQYNDLVAPTDLLQNVGERARVRDVICPVGDSGLLDSIGSGRRRVAWSNPSPGSWFRMFEVA